jgi:hypothetical protein
LFLCFAWQDVSSWFGCAQDYVAFLGIVVLVLMVWFQALFFWGGRAFRFFTPGF